MSEGPRRRLLPRSRRARVGLAVGVLVLLIGGGALGAYLYKRNRTGNIYHPHALFIPQPPPKLPAAPPDRFTWPLYGYTKEHTRYFPAPPRLHPPFKELWVHQFHALLEFPPVMYGSHLFQLADNAELVAIDKRNGRTFWRRQLGSLSASAPAVSATTVYATVLATGDSRSPGRVFAVDSSSGRTLWSRDISSPTESSPLLDRGRLFFGSQSGTVYALDARTGAVLWTYHAGGSVKASPTLSGGTLYFGDYSGHLQAVSEQTGRPLWVSGSEGALLGSGTFYSTPAVLYGRVFLGNTDGRVYAYDASSGRLDWAVQTGAYVYASPAVTDAPGLGPTVYLGSYSGTFYAINARSGQVSWTFDAHGRISGSPTIIGRVVYFAALGGHRSFGLGISTGRLLYEGHTGSFDPVIGDSQHLYLTGVTALYGLAPR